MGVVVLGIVAATTLTVGSPAAALECEDVALDDGCLFTITGGDTEDPGDGFAVTNADGVPLWDFVRARDLQAIGYPISQRWVNGPFTLQAFQKVILQWDPGKSRMNYYNTLDVLANRYPEVELPNVPAHQVLEADRGADFATITRNHLALLDANEAIKARFLSEPDWLNLYGLPIRYEEREVNGNSQGLQMLRAQRAVFVIWNVPAPGTTVGRVNLQNVPDKVKQLSNVIIPDAAKTPVLASHVAALPVFALPTPTPAPTPTPVPTPAPTPVPTPAPALPATAERQILVTFYEATNGASWTTNTNWLSEAPHSEWHGVTTDPAGHVTELRLEVNGLVGLIPPELGHLAELAVLWLNGNQLSGEIPPELGELASLKSLDLANNQLHGGIPPALGRFANLEQLWLSNNQLSGTVPSELSQLASLKVLAVAGNELSGPIPPALGRLANLEQLWLADNQLSGAIPPELRQLAKLQELQLYSNKLSGPIPTGLSRLRNLKGLDMSWNQLSGTIPPELGNLANLESLYLNQNQLSGQIPPELGNLRNLRTLDLAWNQLRGAIPPELEGLTSLTGLWLNGNHFAGCIPEKLRDISGSDLNQLGLPFCAAS